MSKLDKKSDLGALDVKVKRFITSPDEIKDELLKYAERCQKAGVADCTFNEYIQEKYFKDQNVVVVADLSDVLIESQDLRHIDLSGSVLRGTVFFDCTLNDAVFCDTDLDTQFDDCKLGGVDFRGSDLSSTQFIFSEDVRRTPELKAKYIDGIKFSIPLKLAMQYADVRSELNKQKHEEQQRGIFSRTKAELIDKFSSSGSVVDKAKIAELMLMEYIPDHGARQYDQYGSARNKADIENFLDEKYNKIFDQKKKIDLKWSELSWMERGYVAGGMASGNKEYDALVASLKSLQERKFSKTPDYVIHPTFRNLFTENAVYDPAYLRGSSRKQRDQKREYVALDRADIEEYLEAVKKHPHLSLNSFAQAKGEELYKEYLNLQCEEWQNSNPGASSADFVRTKIDLRMGELLSSADSASEAEYMQLESLRERGELTLEDLSNIYSRNTRFIADCGVRSNDMSNMLERPDFSGLKFGVANLSGANFAGANLNGAEFKGTNISSTSFEGAELSGAKFLDNTKARDAKFFNTDLSKTIIQKSDFKRAFMSRSNGEYAEVQESNFNFTDIKKGTWDHVKMLDVTADNANLDGISLARADMRRVSVQHAVLNNAILDGAEIIESDFSHSLMNDVQALKAKIKNTALTAIEAQGIDFTDAELDALTKLDGAYLDSAILTRIKAAGVSFVGANMDHIDAEFADLTKATLDGASLRFAELNNSTLNEAKARKVDMTEAKLRDVKALEADFTKSIMPNIEAQRADFTSATFDDVDLRGSNLNKAILERVKMRRAHLEGVQAHGVKIAEADFDGATVNAASDFRDAIGVDSAKGVLNVVGADGEKIREEAIAQKVKIDNKLAQLENAGTWLKIKNWVAAKASSVTSVAKTLGSVLESVSPAMRNVIVGGAATFAVGLAVAISVGTLGVAPAALGIAATLSGVGALVSGGVTYLSKKTTKTVSKAKTVVDIVVSMSPGAPSPELIEQQKERELCQLVAMGSNFHTDIPHKRSSAESVVLRNAMIADKARAEEARVVAKDDVAKYEREVLVSSKHTAHVGERLQDFIAPDQTQSRRKSHVARLNEERGIHNPESAKPAKPATMVERLESKRSQEVNSDVKLIPN